jgi:hypothetical protein
MGPDLQVIVAAAAEQSGQYVRAVEHARTAIARLHSPLKRTHAQMALSRLLWHQHQRCTTAPSEATGDGPIKEARELGEQALADSRRLCLRLLEDEAEQMRPGHAHAMEGAWSRGTLQTGGGGEFGGKGIAAWRRIFSVVLLN